MTRSLSRTTAIPGNTTLNLGVLSHIPCAVVSHKSSVLIPLIISFDIIGLDALVSTRNSIPLLWTLSHVISFQRYFDTS